MSRRPCSRIYHSFGWPAAPRHGNALAQRVYRTAIRTVAESAATSRTRLCPRCFGLCVIRDLAGLSRFCDCVIASGAFQSVVWESLPVFDHFGVFGYDSTEGDDNDEA